MTFVYFMTDQKTINYEVIQQHVAYLKELKRLGNLVLCGPFSDYPGGMVVVTAEDREAATRIAESDPFISMGFKTYSIRTLELADESNDYLL